MKNRKNCVMGAAALAGCVGMAGTAIAQLDAAWTIMPVLNTGTPLPGGKGTFEGLSPYGVMFDGQSVAFLAVGTGLYRWTNGTIETIIDTTTPIPGSDATFTDFGPPWIDENGVYFVAQGEVDKETRRGVYRSDGAGLHVIADTRTPAPGGAGNFVDFVGRMFDDHVFHYVAAEDGTVVFAGIEPDRVGLYSAAPDGTISTVADSLSELPGLDPAVRVRQYWWPTIDDGDIAFTGFLPAGYFARVDGNFTHIGAAGSPAPGGVLFSGTLIGTPEMHNASMLFLAIAGGRHGIYRWNESGVELVVNTDSVLPGEPGPVTDLYSFAFDRGRTAIVVTGVNGDTLFAEVNGSMRRVIDVSEPLDGRKVASLYLEATCFTQRALLFAAFFADGGKGFYLVRPTCLADWNLDAGVNSQDFFDFLGAFFAGDADFNEDDATNSQDFFDFLGVFFAGC